ncbi:hypothetical protein PTSG_11894 [Salpingoeca rosetta]|uniref:RRM domain-containing protein n=1 Tax=Salpingoeca rosetta (strain ATCC 50818 / BSB-021) TaxID=946362 RepID=F2U2Q4_SALR5|nr:uncharacterized protein PTSG_11894 [Salpingoeca rosetta]EGD81898.1 hypothetical protein PTSG_11894 [Salpingoeca rosetta]|eukprot:XP_004996081.1 hypothetical protein PTSG_11894 [Salpingoeca rosetta]
MEKGWRLVTLDGKRMRISIQDGRRAKDPRDPNATSATPTLRSLPQNPEYATPEIRSVFIANLSTAVTEEQLKDTMAQFGPVATVEVFTRLFTREPTGFATVTFATTKAAKMCALQSGQLRLENQSVYVHMDHAIPNYKADGASATLSEVYMGKYHTDASRGHTPSFPALTQLYPDPLIRPEDMPASPTSSNMGMSPSPDAEYQFSSFGATTTTTNATNADAASTTTTTAAAASTSPASNARADHLPMQQNNSSTHTTPHHHHHRRHHDDERTRGRDRHHSDSDHHHHRDDREREPSSHRRRSGERSGRWSRSPSRTRTRTHAHGHSHAHGHNRDESRRYSSGSFDGESRHQHDDTRDHGYGDHASRRDHTHSHRRNHRGGGSRRGGRSGSRGGSRVGGWNSPSSSWNSGGRAGGDVHGHMRSPISGTSRSPYTPQPHGRYGDRGDHIASPLQSAAAATPPLPPPQLASSSPSTSTPTSHQPLVVLQIPGPFPRRVAPSDWLDFLSEYHPVQARFNTRHSVWRVSFRDKRDADAAARHCLHSQLLGYRLSRPRVLPQRSNSTSDNASHDSHNGTPHSKQQHQQQQQQQQRGGSWGAHAMTTPPTPTANGGAPGQQWGAAAATSWGSTSATPTTPTTPTTPHQQRHAPARKGLLPAPGSSPLVTSPATWVTRPSPSTPMTTAATTPMTTMTPTTGGGGGAGVYDGTTLTAVPKALAALLRNKLGPGGIVEGEGRGSDDEQHASGGAGGARESAHGHEHVRVMTWKEACKQRLSHLLQRSFVLRFSQSVVEAEVRRVVENHFAAIARRQQQLAQEEEDARAHLATPKAVSITSLSSLTIERRKDLPASTRSRLPSHTRARVTGGVRARARRTAVAPTSHVDGARRRRKPIAPQAGGKGDWWADMELASSSSSDEEEEQEQGDDMEEDEEEEEEDVMEDEDEEDESDVAHDHDVEFQHRAKRRHSRRFDSTDDEDDDGEGDDGEWAVAWKRSKTRTSTLSSCHRNTVPTAHVVAAYENRR